jgi:hypothetical protein
MPDLLAIFQVTSFTELRRDQLRIPIIIAHVSESSVEVQLFMLTDGCLRTQADLGL